MTGLWQDLQYSIRSLKKNGSLTVTAIFILAIAISANTGLFTLANAVLLRPVPGVRNPGELVRLFRSQPGAEHANSSYPDYRDYRDQSRPFADWVAERGIPLSFTHGATERIAGAIVTGNYFQVLGVQPAAGRLLGPDDDRAPGAHPVAVLSYSLWEQAFAREPSAIGQKLILNGYAFTIVGVASKEFQGLETGQRAAVWVPMMMQHDAMPRNADSDFLQLRSAGWLNIYGRPRTGMQQLQTRITAIAQGLQRAYPDTNAARSALVTRDVGLDPEQRRDLARLLGLLMASVALLLLIACGNVANLFLTRAVGRRREIAIRLAIGASRARLIRQLLFESLMICAVASALGLAVAPWTISGALKLLGPADVALQVPATLDARVLLFTLGLMLVTSLLFGLTPALQASKTDVVSSLKATTSQQLPARRPPRIATLLMIGQVAMSAILLVGAGLVAQTMLQILAIDRGFSSERVLLAAVDLAIQRYYEARGKQFCERLVGRLSAMPEVESASVSKSEPARDWSDRRAVFLPEMSSQPDAGVLVDANRVSPGYFRTLGISMTAGRDFTWRDRDASQPVAIISEALARRMWPGQNAIGKLIAVDGPRQPLREVVGVAHDAKYRSIVTAPPLLLYEPVMQKYDSYVTIEVRTRSAPAAFAPVLQRELAALDPNVALYNVRTFASQVDRSLWQQRSAAALIAAFSLIALVLAAVGLFSQLAHSVSSRTREIGIRMALGADARAVQRGVMRQGLLLTAIGATAGLLGATALARFAAGLLYGVPARDPLTFALAATVLLIVAIPASYFPARSATRVDPMTALRQD